MLLALFYQQIQKCPFELLWIIILGGGAKFHYVHCTRDISSLVPKSKEDKNDILYSHFLGVLVFCKRVLLVLMMIA